jgi:16S rRNA (cytosine1402-N4)-methyltransferase
MHIPVLYKESIDALNIPVDGFGVYIDGTLGGAGHAHGIMERLSSMGTFIGFDVDPDAINRAKEHLEKFPIHIELHHDNFRNMDKVLLPTWKNGVGGILLDLGYSSYQIDNPEHGLSFLHDGPLDMRLGDGELTAADIINTWSEETLADIFYGYGDETASRLIAKKIVSARKKQKFTTTTELADFIKKVIPFRKGRTHPATKVFQALRITVNDEYGALNDALTGGVELLSAGGRYAIITFHSGEDRIVKNMFKQWSDQGLGNILTKKPIAPSEAELSDNPRARSAKLRIFEKL